MSNLAPRPWTVDEFLDWERQQEDRYEFADGIVRMMVGGTNDHHSIAFMTARVLEERLRGGPCQVRPQGIKVVAASASAYPDVAVTCDPLDGKSDIFPNPVLIVEVLSRTTQDFDRGGKWLAYQTIPSLQHYVLIAQDQVRIELFTRRAGGWDYSVITDPNAEVTFTALRVAIPVAAIYEGTSLQPNGSGAKDKAS